MQSKMAAGDENDASSLNNISSHKNLTEADRNCGNGTPVTLSDYSCPICLQILIEPVVMPCKHELCGPCFKQNVEEANFLCPLCRMRISSWARRNTRNGTLVNCKRWEQIQQLFPTKCQKRLRGEDDEDFFDYPPPKRTISSDGALREEYEAEMNKLQQVREQEMRASEEAIQQLEEEEQRLTRSLEHQTLLDEELARKLRSEDRQQSSQERLSQQSTSGITAVTPRSKVGKNKKKSQNTQASCDSHNRTLDRWFSPTRKLAENQDVVKNRCGDASKSQGFNLTPTKSTVNTQYYNYKERRDQEERDFQLALKLQKEYDLSNKKTSDVERKKGTVDAYLLRGVSQTETSVNSSNQSS